MTPSDGPAISKDMKMGHKVRIHSKEQHIAALRVLDCMKGTWLGIGPSSAPVLVVTDEQYSALVEAGVVPANGKEVQARGKKATPRKARS
jgi:hypothetical protein